jgi:hypothetical protein
MAFERFKKTKKFCMTNLHDKSVKQIQRLQHRSYYGGGIPGLSNW